MRPTLVRSLCLTLAVTASVACGSKESKEEAPPPAGSAAASGSGSGAQPAPRAEAPPAPRAEAPPASGSALPDACNEYRATVQRLSQCGGLPAATHDNLKARFERQWAGWEKLPDKDKATLAAICKSSADTVKAAASAACKW
jgi:hypothetical protein